MADNEDNKIPLDFTVVDEPVSYYKKSFTMKPGSIIHVIADEDEGNSCEIIER